MRVALLVLLSLPVVASPEDDEARIQKLFEALSALGKEGGAQALSQHFDTRAIRAALEECGLEGASLTGAMLGIGITLEEALADIGFARIRVRKIVVAADKKSAYAVVDHFQDDVWSRFRWELVQRPAGWALTDFQNLETGLRLAATLGASVAAMVGGGMEAFDRYEQADQLAEQGNYREAIAMYRSLLKSNLPRGLKATCVLDIANSCFAMDDYEGVLAACDEAEDIDPMPGLDYLRAVAHNALKQYDRAAAAAQAYIDAVGPDADAYAEMGDAYLDLGKPAEAARAYAAGLEEMPDSGLLVASLAVALPYDRKEEAVKRFRALKDPKEWMETIGEHCLARDDWIALAAFAKAYAEVAPGSSDAVYYDARIRAHHGAHEEAAKRLLAALPRIDDAGERSAFVYWYIDSMTEAGKPIEGYQALPPADRASAFYTLADLFMDEGKADELDALIGLRAREPAAKELLLVWKAEVLWMRKSYAEVARFVAEKHATITVADEDRLWLAEDRWVRALHRLKRHDDALLAAAKCADPDLSLLAHAANGDLDAATRAFERCLDRGWEPTDLYADEDIGPLLKGERFAPLRAKYPPAK